MSWITGASRTDNADEYRIKHKHLIDILRNELTEHYNSELAKIRAETAGLRTEFERLRDDLDSMRGDVDDIKGSIKTISLKLSNLVGIRPRPNPIIEPAPTLEYLGNRAHLEEWIHHIKIKLAVDRPAIGNQRAQFYYILSRMAYGIQTQVIANVQIGDNPNAVFTFLRSLVPEVLPELGWADPCDLTTL